ncbi:ABC transporter ATP-binding protein [Streptomyces sp. 4.24]|uniref:ABC transporter ATP-binding protein n=1 Tax=Streptomyces tritrimontium TaxID=3406573 RepID=UPI003BB74FF7
MATSATRPDPPPVVRAEHVDHYFVTPGGEAVHALRDVSLTVHEGEFVCVVGPSGCGKSTLLRMLGGLVTPSSGLLVPARSRDGRPAAAFVFQDCGVLPWLTVRANAAFGLRMAGVRRRAAEERAAHWLARTGLTDFADAYPHQLSGGMRQRLAVARAYASGSPLLLMDEPLGALDPQTRRLMQEHLLELWQEEKKTVVLVTHSLDEALLLGERVLVMSERPGGFVDSFTVPLPRPRRSGVQDTAAFAALRARVWNSLTGAAVAAPGPATSGPCR